MLPVEETIRQLEKQRDALEVAMKAVQDRYHEVQESVNEMSRRSDGQRKDMIRAFLKKLEPQLRENLCDELCNSSAKNSLQIYDACVQLLGPKRKQAIRAFQKISPDLYLERIREDLCMCTRECLRVVKAINLNYETATRIRESMMATCSGQA
jgi:predicted CopG family antitoxin